MNILVSVSFVVGMIAVAIILWGVILGLLQMVKSEFYRLRRKPEEISLHKIRHIMASYLLLGLEFLIAADIIRTIVQPTLEELALLGSIVVIRTIISYFLGKEMGEGRMYSVPKK